jgi:hypothetical protein
MTAENDGSDGPPPEGEDPFAYLYRQEGESGASAQERQAPRRSFDQVRPVGQRPYGPRAAAQPGRQGPAGHAPFQEGHGDAYGPQSPSAHYAAPEMVPGGRDAVRQGPQQPPAQHGHGGHGGHGGGHAAGQGRSRNGLLIGSIAVVAAVVLGICAAIFLPNQDSGDNGGQAGGDPGRSADGGQQNPGTKPVHRGQKVGQRDAAKLQLAGGAAPASDVPGARAESGQYVGGMNRPGASATWTVKAPKAGMYTFFVGYGVAGQDADSRLTVNDKPQSRPINLQNFSHTPDGQWDKGWQQTWSWLPLRKGTNTIKISCEQGNKCNYNLDRVWLKYGQVKH